MSTTVKELVTARVNLVKHPKEGSNVLAFATLLVADGFMAVEEVRVMKNHQGDPFVALPGRPKNKLVKKGEKYLVLDQKTKKVSEVVCEKEGYYPDIDAKTGKQIYSDTAHPITAANRNLLNSVVLNAYAAAVAQAKANAAAQQ